MKLWDKNKRISRHIGAEMLFYMLNIKDFDFFAFDFDGTLVDSHPIYLEKDKLYINHFYNQDISRNFLEQQELKFRQQLNIPYSIEYYLFLDRLFGTGKLTAEEISSRLSWFDENTIKPLIKPKPGAIKALKTIKSEFPDKKLLLVTGSKRAEIDYFSFHPLSNLRDHLNINSFFDCVITQDDVLEQKPSPEPYKKALDAIGASSDSSFLVFEDSVDGVLSAKANHATVVAIENKHINNDDKKLKDLSDYYFRDWKSILDNILG